MPGCRWMRTTINFQYRYGMTTGEALRHLYNEGGIRRFYRGVGPALFQGPLSRFGDTAANAGMLALWDSMEVTKGLPMAAKTVSASAGAAAFRVVLMPIDACKTIMQVEGASGMAKMQAKIAQNGIGVLWHGATGAMVATFVGHYPFFFTYNYLQSNILLQPGQGSNKKEDGLAKFLGRNALIGFCSSAVSDTCSNSVRVVKTTVQSATEPISYPAAIRMIIANDGLSGLFLRGLGTKLISNGISGIMFSVMWRLGMDYMDSRNAEKDKK
jgi:hypothetical protein